VLTFLCCLVHVPGVRVREDWLRGPDERAVDLPPHPRQHGAGRLHLGELRQEEQSDHVSKGQSRCFVSRSPCWHHRVDKGVKKR
jgi:hypothetical protein